MAALAWLAEKAAPYVLVALVAFGGAIAWENRAPNTPRFLFWSIGDSLAAQRDRNAADATAWRTAFGKEQASFRTLEGALDLQNQAAQSVATQSQAWQSRSDSAVAAATSANAWRLKLAETIRAPPSPAGADYTTACHAAESVLREGGQ
jgi:hypothetical protein